MLGELRIEIIVPCGNHVTQSRFKISQRHETPIIYRMTTAATPPTERANPQVLQRARDEQHLRMLVVFYYILAGLSLLFGCLGLVYIGGGTVLAFLPQDAFASDPDAPPVGVIHAVGWVVVAIGALAAVIQLAGSLLMVLAGRFIAARRHRMFCLVVAGLTCLQVPLGTALGVCTFVVLTREWVIELFGGRTPPAIGH